MDFSDKYCAMCKAATELQEAAMQMVKKDNGISPKDFWAKMPTQVGGLEGMIWLPRQDQLQALIPSMVDGTFGNEVPEIFEGQKIIIKANPHIDTMEQLWICTVMKWVYQKVYNIKTEKWES